MALIKINIDQAVASESAAKKPAYKIAKVGGVQTLVVSAAQKSSLTQIVAALKDARTLAITAINARVKAATAFTKANQAPKGPKRTALKETYKTQKQTATSNAREAKARIREANSIAKKAGLGGLNLPLSASDIVITGPGATAALKKIRAIKVNEFGVTGKRGMFKPKFFREETFEQMAEKGAPKGSTKPIGQAAALKRTKKRVEEERSAKNAASALDAALSGNPDKEVKKVGNITLDSYTTSRVPGTKVTIDAHDRFPASKEVRNIVKNLIEKGGVSKGKFRVAGDKIEYKLGTASYRMQKNRTTGKWDSVANFGGKGGGSMPGYSLQSARKGLEASIKRLQKFKKVDRMAAQNSWMKGK